MTGTGSSSGMSSARALASGSGALISDAGMAFSFRAVQASSAGRSARALNCFKEKREPPGDDGDVLRRSRPEVRSLTSPTLPNAVDLRGLPPPEPLERILAAIGEGLDAPLAFLLSREPLPLYLFLRREGLRYRVRRLEAGVEIVIERPEHKP